MVNLVQYVYYTYQYQSLQLISPRNFNFAGDFKKSAFESINSCTVSLHPSMHANINGLKVRAAQYIKHPLHPRRLTSLPEHGGGWFIWFR